MYVLLARAMTKERPLPARLSTRRRWRAQRRRRRSRRRRRIRCARRVLCAQAYTRKVCMHIPFAAAASLPQSLEHLNVTKACRALSPSACHLDGESAYVSGPSRNTRSWREERRVRKCGANFGKADALRAIPRAVRRNTGNQRRRHGRLQRGS